VQEAFLSAFKSARTFDERFGFRTWLWTILLNQCRTMLKRRGRSQVVAWTDAGEGAGPPESPDAQLPSPAAALLSRERTELVERLLGRLKEKEADALRLRFFGGLKFQEIADAVGCSLATAKNRVKSGLVKMAEMMGE
jgi:RNA polymerase sigma-70 factor (ECF subfamily)